MPIPWLAALKVIPWTTILSNAPELARSAERLLSNTRTKRPPLASADDLQNLTTRVEELEQRDRETAQLVDQIADQVAALSIASEVLQARARWMLVLTIALVVATLVLAGVMVFGR